MNDNKTITINQAVERMITAVNIVTGDDGHRSQEAVRTFLELLKMSDKEYNKQQRYYYRWWRNGWSRWWLDH